MALLDSVPSLANRAKARYAQTPSLKEPEASLRMPAMGPSEEDSGQLMSLLTNRPSAMDRFNRLQGLNQQANMLADKKATAISSRVPQTGNKAIDAAMTQLGSPYIWADMNPQGKPGGPGTGFDCSGLTKWAYSKMGIELPHSAAQQRQMANIVGRNQLQPGMLVFFNYGRLGPNLADHVGIYLGNGKMIAASSSQDKVVTQTVDWAHFFGGGYVR